VSKFRRIGGYVGSATSFHGKLSGFVFRHPSKYSSRESNSGTSRIQNSDPNSRSGNHRQYGSSYKEQREYRGGQSEDGYRGGYQRGRHPRYRGRRAGGGNPYYY
jgi:hypothetical protein